MLKSVSNLASMKYIVAVSGGVDSVALLDMLANNHDAGDLVVAHFDHGIRPDSVDDARFVAGLARKYNLQFETSRAELGPDASEAQARQSRYEFLRQVAARHQARIVTAHHSDDVVGSIIINIIRGTGWRGLAPFGADDVERPLLGRTKSELYQYAIDQGLEYVEDSSNQDPKFLRNQLTGEIKRLSPTDRAQLLELYGRQHNLRQQINQVINDWLQSNQVGRRSFDGIDDGVAKELIRAYIHQQSGVAVMWPAVERALGAIRHGQTGKQYQLGDKISIWLKPKHIIVGDTPPVLS